jgi:hypothetical protein
MRKENERNRQRIRTLARALLRGEIAQPVRQFWFQPWRYGVTPESDLSAGLGRLSEFPPSLHLLPYLRQSGLSCAQYHNIGSAKRQAENGAC